MFSVKTVSTIVKVMILSWLIFNSKPVEATRPLVVMKSNKFETVKVSVSKDRAKVHPSGPNPCTYLPDPGKGSGCHP